MRTLFFLLSPLVALVVICGSDTVGVAAADHAPVFLLENFARHAPKNEIASLPGAVKGDGDFAGDILLPDISFAGHKWMPRLEFQEEKLIRISLMAAYSDERLETLTSHLRNNKYEMLALLVDDRSLDFISFLKIDGPQALQEKIKEMLSGETHKRITYAWFITEGLSRETKIMARNLKDFFMLAPATTREVEVTLLRVDNAGRMMLFVDFTYPILDVM